MAKAKLTNFAQVLRLLTTLTDDEKATLRDVLRPEPTKRASTKRASKKPKPTEATLPLISADAVATDSQPDAGLCATCGNDADYQDHFEPSPHFHTFEPTRAKGASKKAA